MTEVIHSELELMTLSTALVRGRHNSSVVDQHIDSAMLFVSLVQKLVDAFRVVDVKG